MMRRWILVLVVLSGLGVTLTGCTHTVHGVGKDTENAGESMQDYNK